MNTDVLGLGNVIKLLHDLLLILYLVITEWTTVELLNSEPIQSSILVQFLEPWLPYIPTHWMVWLQGQSPMDPMERKQICLCMII